MNGVKTRNDLPALVRDLRKGVPVRILAAPAALAALQDLPGVPGFLRSLGVRGFHPVLPFADITVWACYRLLLRRDRGVFIASACAGMNRYFDLHGEWDGERLPVFSPLLCAARYLRKYRSLGERFAFLSPCAQKWREFNPGDGELVHYNITITALRSWLEKAQLALNRDEAWEIEKERNLAGLTVAVYGSIGKSLQVLLPDLVCHVEQGVSRAAAWLAGNGAGGELPAKLPLENTRRSVFEPYACVGGCSRGAGLGKAAGEAADSSRITTGFLQTGETPAAPDPLAAERIGELFEWYDSNLDISDFCYPTETGITLR
jgi:iron only hydrogenase large subunit-like protein